MHAFGKTVQLHLPLGDHITKVILESGNWYERMMLNDIYNRLKDSTGCAVDVGACYGTHTVWFSQICGFKEVHAFEPAPDNFELLIQNALQYEGVHLYNVALGAEAGFVTTRRINDRNRGMTQIIPASQSDTPIAALDSYNLQNVRLIKIDVEGAEMEVLEGAQDTIDRCRPLMYIEAATPLEYSEVRNFMREIGYRQIGKWNKTPTYGWSPE